MKSSEYINTILRYPIFTQKEYLKNIKDYDINLKKMDKRFIDKEELKSKIHKNSKCLNIDTEYYNGYRQAIKDVLELIK